MRRRALIGLGVAAALLVGIVVGSSWLAGPRAALPTVLSATQAPGDTSAAPFVTPRPPGLPDPARTPGSINPAATQANLADTVCKSGWAATQRPPSAYTSALKIAQILEYGYADKDRSHYQEDHLVPLELGGAPRDPRNLWPEPNKTTLPDGTSIGSAEKDDLEDALHAKVCAGDMALADAQRLIAGNWYDAWKQLVRP
ncbi:MAG TPA: hypothetical protein VGM94_08540 [Galbitalea sp.]